MQHIVQIAVKSGKKLQPQNTGQEKPPEKRGRLEVPIFANLVEKSIL